MDVPLIEMRKLSNSFLSIRQDGNLPEWIFLWAVRLDLEENDLPQVSQACLESPECI